MKTVLLLISFLFLIACSNQAMYGMMHEQQRQECLAKGRADCNKAEPYDEYQRERDDLLKK